MSTRQKHLYTNKREVIKKVRAPTLEISYVMCFRDKDESNTIRELEQSSD